LVSFGELCAGRVVKPPPPDRPGPQQHSWWKGLGMLQTTSTERRAAGGDRPRSGGSVKRRPSAPRPRLKL